MTWTTTRIQHLATEVTDSVDPAEFGDELVAHFSIPALDSIGGPEIQPAFEIQSAKQPLRGGEVLISRLNPRKARVLTVPSSLDHPGVGSGEFIVLEPSAAVEPRFLEYLLLSESTRQFLDGAVQSVTRSHQRIRPEHLMKLEVAAPAMAEQRAIADYLDAETSRIDALIAKKQQLIHLLEERIDALIDAHFAPRGLEPTVRLARLATVQTGVTLNSAKVSERNTVRMPYLRVANVQPGWLDLSEVKEVDVEPAAAARSLLRVGDVLMTEGGDIDKLGRGTVWKGQIENCLHQNHVFAVRPRAGRLDSDFLANVTRTSHARAYFESTGVQSTNLASTNSFKVSDFRVPALDVETQRDRCSSYAIAVAPLHQTSKELSRQLELLAEHRQALITAAVTGEFAVPGAA